MKIRNFLLITLITTKIFGCPYTFLNDSDTNVFLADKIEKGQLVKPQASVTVDAPMSPEHDHNADEGHKWNGHARIYVYQEEKSLPGNFKLQYKISEAACGKDSKLAFNELGAMAAGQKDSGRFEIKKMTAERKERKMEQLTQKGQESLKTEENEKEVEETK